MFAATRACRGPYCCELIPIFMGPPASAVAVVLSQSTSEEVKRVSAFAFIAVARPAIRRTVRSCQADEGRTATSLKEKLLFREACHRPRRVGHAEDQRQPRSHE